jgi:hypothetical protein
MATRSKTPPPVPRILLAPPAVLLLIAVVLAILGTPGVAAGVLLIALGTWLALVGKHKRWKGSAQGGYVLVGFGLLVILLALFA